MSEEAKKHEDERSEATEKASWYVLHTYSGYENKVAGNIMTLAANKGLQDMIQDVLVPVCPATDDYGKPIIGRDGKQKEEKKFPCYVYVKMINNEKTWYECRNIRGVTGFVGAGSEPTPLTDEEMENLGIVEKKPKAAIKVGDWAVIVNCSTNPQMNGNKVIVREINEDAGEVTVGLQGFFGRETPTTISLSEIEKIN